MLLPRLVSAQAAIAGVVRDESGVTYTPDWSNDDQAVPDARDHWRPLFDSVRPRRQRRRAAVEGGLTGPQYGDSLIDQFDQLLPDSRTHPRVMGIPLHPYLAGQPDRIGHLE